jgi:hypothetical protein
MMESRQNNQCPIREVKIKEAVGIDKTQNLPKRTLWVESLKSLNVGDYFRASKIYKTTIYISMKRLKEKEDLHFTTRSLNEEEFITIRTK